jgi:ParB family chromosome partitioning protein
MPTEQIQEVAFTDIEMVPLLRKEIDQEKLGGLIRSIEEVGLLYPPRLTRQGEKFVPADGFHRLLAFMKLGRKSIPAIIEEKPLSEGAMIQKGLIANAHHSDFTPVEKAEAIARLMEMTGWNASTVADKLGFSNATVSRLLALLQLPEAIRERVQQGKIPLSAASELVRIEDSESQAALAAEVAAGRMTRDGLAGTVKSRLGGNGGPRETASRICCTLPAGGTVTVKAERLDLEGFISALEEVLAKARKARSQGVEVGTFAKMLRDQAKTPA